MSFEPGCQTFSALSADADDSDDDPAAIHTPNSETTLQTSVSFISYDDHVPYVDSCSSSD